jgi:pyridoxamine 5'-phosphate oxidase
MKWYAALVNAAPDAATENPLELFDRLYQEAVKAIPVDPNAMVLGTATREGRPSSRVVLLRGFDSRGFTFFTNLRSRKARELLENPRASLNFFWRPLDKQVRVEGRAEQVSDEEADRYFAGRPRESQIGAWASLQSEPLSSRAELDARVAALEAQYQGGPVPRPPHWSGFRVTPEEMEFWTARPFRLHERVLFRRVEGGWTRQLLYP